MYHTKEPPSKMKLPTPMQLSIKRSNGFLRVRPYNLYSWNKSSATRTDDIESANNFKSDRTQALQKKNDGIKPLLDAAQEAAEGKKSNDEQGRMSQKMWLAKLAAEASTAITSMSSTACESSSTLNEIGSGPRIKECNDETVFTEYTDDTGYTDWDDWTADANNEHDDVAEVMGGGCGFGDEFSDGSSRVGDDEVTDNDESGCWLGEELNETLMSLGGCVHFYVPGFSIS
ncbi:hypothetical protein ACHAXS_011133 [Conticribra weissflogii]